MTTATEANLEPLYTFPEALPLTGFPSIAALKMFLARNPAMAGRRYRRSDGRRLLTASEIRIIRAGAVKGNLP